MKKHKNIIKERYNRLGGSLYDLRYTEEQLEKYKHILDELNEPRLLLDNGCGTGLLFPLIDCTLVGLDFSCKLLSTARERNKQEQHLIQGDSENLPFRDSVFDSAVSVTVIQNLSSPEKLPLETARVVKPCSIVIISSLKRVYSRDEICKLVESDELFVRKILTNENINDWITISTRKQ
ncbi:class I SAM-dependent methyltransferase [Thermoproteota archaeon]